MSIVFILLGLTLLVIGGEFLVRASVGLSFKLNLSKKEVLKQIIPGLELFNESFGTKYKLSKIYFLPSDRASNSVYNLLISKLIRHYHSGN